jgi:hypothetical protein
MELGITQCFAQKTTPVVGATVLVHAVDLNILVTFVEGLSFTCHGHRF